MAEAERITLDDILSEPKVREPRRAQAEPKIVETKEPVAPEPKLGPAKETPKAAEPARGPDGKFAAKEEAPPEPPKPEAKPPEPQKPAQAEFNERERAFLAAAQEERRKRQALERQISEQQQKNPDGTPKTFWDDPEGHFARFRDEIAQTATSARLGTAEQIARSRYGNADFDAKVQKFAEVMQNAPGLYQQWLSSPDPAEFAYKTGKFHMELSEAGNLDAYRQRIEQDVRKNLEAEYAAKMKKTQEEEQKRLSELAGLPKSLSDAHGAPQNEVKWTGPTSLDDILHSE